MRHHLFAFTVALLCGLFLLPGALSASPRAESPLAVERASEISSEDLSLGIRRFGFDLLRMAGTLQPGQNIVLSPYSVASAVTMVYAGAEGDTAGEIADTLHVPDAPQSLLRSAGDLYDSLTRDTRDEANALPDATDPFTLRIANGIWVDTAYRVQDAFLTRLSDTFRVELSSLDFAGNPEVSRRAINEWIEDQTEGRIAELLGQGSITPLTRLVLANAVYFLASWQHPFPEGATQPGVFRTADGRERDVPFMRLEARLPVSRVDETVAVELAYAGSDVSFIALMPRDSSTWTSWQEALDHTLFDRVLESLAATQAAVAMPRFSAETSLSLPDIMRQLGMRDAFDQNRADLSGISGSRDLYVTDLIHQSVIEVDEAGTEAAAATAAVIAERSLPPEPIQIRFDRPFAYVVYDHNTGSILFAGRVMDPSL